MAGLFRLLSCRFDSIKFRCLLLFLFFYCCCYRLVYLPDCLFTYVHSLYRYVFVCMYVRRSISCDICPGWLPFRISRNDDVKRNIVRCCIFSVFIFFSYVRYVTMCPHKHAQIIHTNKQSNKHSSEPAHVYMI